MMECYQSVIMTDGVDRKNHMIPLRTIIEAYRDSWYDSIPMYLEHDRTKPIGYAKETGIYMEPGKAYLTNASVFASTKEDVGIVHCIIKNHNYKVFCENHKDELEALIEKLGDKLSDNFCVAPVSQAVAVMDKDIVYRLFPEFFETTKDGLIDARNLEPIYIKDKSSKFDILVPGVYRKGEYLLFAHQFFRRSLSVLNSLNAEFFNSFEKLRDTTSVEMHLALDMDMIGLVGTECLEIECQYIRGPHFNDDLTSIPEGVTCHENEHYDNQSSDFSSTQFYWHMQDGKRTFECEELCDRENVSFDNRQSNLWGCRYVHSMISPSTGLPIHLDGAVRLYDDEQILKRISSKTDISKYGKDSKYVKLWRVDNSFSISMWKELISSFYRENALVGEYFGGIDENYDQIKIESGEHNSIHEKLNDFSPIDLGEGDGIRIYFRYDKKFDIAKDRDIEVYNEESFIFGGGEIVRILDVDAVTLLKYLQRKGLNIRIPNTTLAAFNDMVYNFPTLQCRCLNVADVVLTAISEFCQAWNKRGDDRLISFGIMINLAEEAEHLSFAGHVNDFVKLFKSLPKMSAVSFDEWIEAVYHANNIFKPANNHPNKFHLINGDMIRFKRTILHPDKIKRLWLESDVVHAQLNIDEREREWMSQHKITGVPFYRVNRDICGKCGKDYIKCGCVKFIDEDVFDDITSADLLGLILTNRNAFYPNERLKFIQ